MNSAFFQAVYCEAIQRAIVVLTAYGEMVFLYVIGLVAFWHLRKYYRNRRLEKKKNE